MQNREIASETYSLELQNIQFYTTQKNNLIGIARDVFPCALQALSRKNTFLSMCYSSRGGIKYITYLGLFLQFIFHWTINIWYSRWAFFFLCLIIPATCTWESASPTRLSDRSSTHLSGRHCHPVAHHELTAFLAVSANTFETIRMWKIIASHSITPSK